MYHQNCQDLQMFHNAEAPWCWFLVWDVHDGGHQMNSMMTFEKKVLSASICLVFSKRAQFGIQVFAYQLLIKTFS